MHKLLDDVLCTRNVRSCGVYKSSPTNFHEISRIHFFKFQKIFLRDKPQKPVKFVMTKNEHCDDELQPMLITVPEIRDG